MPRISNTNGRRMVALDLTPREQRGPYEMHDNFSPIDPPHPNLAGWALQVVIAADGDAVGTRRTEWSGFADTHNRLSSRCQSVVWFLTLRPSAVSGPIAGYLPEASAPTVGRTGNPNSDQRGGRADRTTFGLGPVRTENTGRTENERRQNRTNSTGAKRSGKDVRNAQTI